MVKYRGKIRITKEMTKSILGLPEEIQLNAIHYDPVREIYEFIISSDAEQGGWTFATGEGQEATSINSDVLTMAMRERLLELIDREGIATNDFFRVVLERDEG